MASTSDWSDDELRASVAAYLQMRDMHANGQSFVKKHIYRALASRFQRTEKAYEYRMQNISYVFSLLGRRWLPGLLPAKNVGDRVAAKIEHFIIELEGRQSLPAVEERIKVRELRARPSPTPPPGNKQPTTLTAPVTSYVRDPAVRAWTLTRADGVCECCRKPAPFEDIDGLPFLEVHHVRHLADGGSDCVANAAAVCPNCHRRLHYGYAREEARAWLLQNVPELASE